MGPGRVEKLLRVAASRQADLTVLLENVHDPLNIGAVLRSCDSVGIREVFVLHSDEAVQRKWLPLGKRSSMGTRKWVDVHYYTDHEACFAHVRSSYGRLLAAAVTEEADSLYEADLKGSLAILFGNEREGLSPQAIGEADGMFYIPQIGMAESLNISVACAVTVYEAFRQRGAWRPGYLNETLDARSTSDLQADYLMRAATKEKRRGISPEKG